MSWTDERVEKLKVLWSEGRTASQIATELGNVTRNAVIGKVHRLGLSNRTQTGNEGGSAEVVDTAKAKIKTTPRQTPPPEPPKTAQESKAPPLKAEPAVEKPSIPPTTQADTEQFEEEEDFEEAIAPETTSMDPDRARAIAAVAEIERNARKLSLLELTERTCKWPIGDPSTDDFWFCGHACAVGKPYCEAHVAVAYQPMSSRRERDRARQAKAAAAR